MADDADTGDKTEDPTGRKLDDARKRGDVVKSQEVSTWFVLAGATLVLMTFSGGVSATLTATMRGLIANSYDIRMDGPALPLLFQRISLELLAAISIPIFLLLLAAIGGNVIQHRLVWSYESLTPKFSKISPLAGLKRLFSMQSLANFAKGLVKLLVVGAVLIVLMWPERLRMEELARSDLIALLPLVQALAVKQMGAAVAIMAIVGAADYLFQYRQWWERQKMSLSEVKDEFKNTEGNPAVKGKLKQVRHIRMRRRIIAAVPKASVVITNPTHFAVALQWERGMAAPRPSPAGSPR